MLSFSARNFYLAIFFILTVFLAFQSYSTFTNSVGLDEFHNVYIARKILEFVPYRDWQPFKTTLALYFHSLPFHFLHDQWQIIHFLKLTNIALVFLVLFGSSIYLPKFSSKSAVILGLILLTCHTTFLASSLEIRPDLLNAMTGFISLLLILESRAILAGFFVALSFCLSQKGIFYFFSTNVALIFIYSFYHSTLTLQQIIKFNVFFLLGFFFYLIYASWDSSLGTVAVNIFFKHLYLLSERNYPDLKVYWIQAIIDNPLFAFLSSLSFYYVIKNWKGVDQKYRFIFFYALSMIVCCLLYPEPLPYFFILLLPTLYVLTLISIENYLLPILYRLSSGCHRSLVVVGFLGLGVIYPLLIYFGTWQSGQAYQQVMTIVGNHLLMDDDRYFAGTSFLTFKEQSNPELVWLDMRKLNELNRADQQQQSRILKQFIENPPKFIYSNYRIDNLPTKLVDYFEKNYFHYFGNIFVYSAEFEPKMSSLEIDYSGEYQVLSDSLVEIKSGLQARSGDIIRLTKGSYPLVSNQKFRLILKPKLQLGSHFDKYREPRD